MFFTKGCPSGGTEYVSFELFLGILRGKGRGEGAPLVRYLCKTQKSLHGRHCLRNAEFRRPFASHDHANPYPNRRLHHATQATRFDGVDCMRFNLDVFEAHVTVTPPTGDFKNFKFFQNSQKILNIYF